jgi:hypothetical protein
VLLTSLSLRLSRAIAFPSFRSQEVATVGVEVGVDTFVFGEEEGETAKKWSANARVRNLFRSQGALWSEDGQDKVAILPVGQSLMV